MKNNRADLILFRIEIFFLLSDTGLIILPYGTMNVFESSTTLDFKNTSFSSSYCRSMRRTPQINSLSPHVLKSFPSPSFRATTLCRNASLFCSQGFCLSHVEAPSTAHASDTGEVVSRACCFRQYAHYLSRLKDRERLLLRIFSKCRLPIPTIVFSGLIVLSSSCVAFLEQRSHAG